MDFGIAKAEGVQITRAGYTLGTPYYMPPEQVLGKPLTPQADVYSFGILLYELMTGVRPVAGGSVEQIFQAILHAPLDFKPLKALRLPQALNLLIERCTAKEAERRPSGMDKVCAELEAVLQTSPAGRLLVPPERAAVPKLLERLPPRLRTNAALMLLACSAVVIVVAVLLAILRLTHAYTL
jgi:serine/threonine-protein kinase